MDNIMVVTSVTSCTCYWRNNRRRLAMRRNSKDTGEMIKFQRSVTNTIRKGKVMFIVKSYLDDLLNNIQCMVTDLF